LTAPRQLMIQSGHQADSNLVFAPGFAIPSGHRP
jgi:hypothetical protein